MNELATTLENLIIANSEKAQKKSADRFAHQVGVLGAVLSLIPKTPENDRFLQACIDQQTAK